MDLTLRENAGEGTPGRCQAILDCEEGPESSKICSLGRVQAIDYQSGSSAGYSRVTRAMRPVARHDPPGVRCAGQELTAIPGPSSCPSRFRRPLSVIPASDASHAVLTLWSARMRVIVVGAP